MASSSSAPPASETVAAAEVAASSESSSVSPDKTTTTTTTEDLTYEQAMSLADSLFVDEVYEEAVDAYTAALTLLPNASSKSSSSSSPQQSTTILRFRILSHRSAAFYQMQRFSEALDDAAQANEIVATSTTDALALLRPGETELILRRLGMAALQCQQYEQALSSLEKAHQLANFNHRPTTKLYPPLIQQCRNRTITCSSSSSSRSQTSEKATATTTATAASSTTTQVVAPPARAVPPANNKDGGGGGMPKYQYYQSDQIMTIAILEPNVSDEQLDVQFDPQYLTVVLRKKNQNNNNQNKSYTVIAGKLYAKIQPELCRTKLRPEKILLKLRKVDAFEWPELLIPDKSSSSSSKKKSPPNTTTATTTTTSSDETNQTVAPETATTDSSATNETVPAAAAASSSTTTAATTTAKPTTKSKLARPYASHKDWDSIEKEIEQEEANEKPAGDQAMNQLFQQIYQNADEDTRRAMIKSYQTSGGTVLSTNWQEVAQKDYEQERTAPKGMEWKTWEGDKLPMKKDDD